MNPLHSSDARADLHGQPVKEGQFWRHIGGEGVPATGLLARILEVHGTHFFIDYPPGDHTPRKCHGWTMGRYWENVSPDQARMALLEAQEA